MNLACGLNWHSDGLWNEADDQAIMVSDDPRVVNRRGLELASKRALDLLGPDRRRLAPLLARKFALNWSGEEDAYYANASAIPAEQRPGHWLTRHGASLRVLSQIGLMVVLTLAGVGFWRRRRSLLLALISSTIGAFVLLHTAFEVQDRYHFVVMALLTAPAGAACFPGDDKEPSV
jgi:hypothetical protein